MQLPSPLLTFLKVVTGKPTIPKQLPEIQDTQELLLRGKYDEGKMKLQEFRDYLSANVSEKEAQIYTLYADLIDVYIDASSGKGNEALQQAELLYLQSYETNNPILKVLSKIEVGNCQYSSGMLNEAFETLSETQTEVESLKFYYPEYYNQFSARIAVHQSKVLRRRGEFESGIANLEKAIEIYESTDNELALAEPLNDLGITYASTGDMNSALPYLERSKDIYESLNHEGQLLKIYNNIGEIYRRIGNLEDAIESLTNAITISQKTDNTFTTATIMANIGTIYVNLGNLNQAEKSMRDALQMFEELDRNDMIAHCYLHLANIISEKGDLDMALEYMNTSLKINTELENKQDIAQLYNNIGGIYNKKGDLEQAIQYANSSIEILEELGEKNYIISSIWSIIGYYTQLERKAEAEAQLKKLEVITKEVGTKYTEMMYKLASAEILKVSDRVVQRAEAQKILSEISNDKDLEQQYQLQAMLSLADLLLQELKISSSEEALGEFKEIIDKIFVLNQNPETGTVVQAPVQVQVLMLQSKLALIDLKVEEAQKILDDALAISDERGYESFSKMITEEKDTIKNEMLKYKKMVESNASLYERLQQTQIENYLKRAESILRR